MANAASLVGLTLLLVELCYAKDKCGNKFYDKVKQLCCKDNVVNRFNSNATGCCGIHPYDPFSEYCCDGIPEPASGGNPQKDYSCCSGKAYDTRCYECGNGHYNPKFDVNKELCCEGVVHPLKFKWNCCCGKILFDPTYSICCDNKLKNRTKGDKDNCCECSTGFADIGIVADSSESIELPNWIKLLNFIVQITDALDIDTGRVNMGMLTYRHNVTVEFGLDKYGRRSQIQNYVKKIKYIRGSTNTSEALKVLRQQIFSARGDRVNVPNYALVITDGNSDNRNDTFREAAITRSKGIHIFAVGVGEKIDMVELKGIASKPPDLNVNVFHVDNFDGLKKLETRLKKTLADVCTRRPTEKVLEPCGDTVYDPEIQVCCDGVPQEIKSDDPKDTRCCFKKSYNIRTHICCKGNVDELKWGRATKCCARKAYDSKNMICCYGNTPLYKAGEGATECCGNETYDRRLAICCEDTLQIAYGIDGQSTACCVNTSYDTACYECVDGVINATFDCAYQLCCNGKVLDFTTEKMCCCGQTAFDPRNGQICCNGELQPRREEDVKDCCECPAKLIDICVVLDSSESVGPENWKRLEKFVDDFIDTLEIDNGNIRLAVISYRHSVTIEFHLNRFKTAAEMKKAVDTFKYVPGSTNTAGAIHAMWKEVFTAANGDRPQVSNLGIVITDGQSDIPQDTKKEATLAKLRGIHIFALGIGVENENELKVIASEPADDNYMNINDFEGLDTIESQVFSDALCPRKVTKRCKEPCGPYRIDRMLEICCDEVPQWRLAGNRTLCCEHKSYDPDCYICCGGRLRNRYAGEYTKCCCHEAYDERREICCGNQILPRLSGNDDTCCHNATYDASKEVCCNGVHIQPRYGKLNTACCGNVSYDTNCFKCENDVVIALFDSQTEMCCEGNISKKEFGKASCCCGKKQFSADTHICCNRNLVERPDGPEVVCCNKLAYNPKESICCDGSVQERLNGYETLCCGKSSYHPDRHYCCEGQLNEKRTHEDDCCCRKRVFNPRLEFCCHGKVQDLIQEGNASSTACCGQKAYDPSRQICCDGAVNRLYRGNTLCCGRKSYDPKKYVCNNGQLESVFECAGLIFNKDKQICCAGRIIDVVDKQNTRCCHNVAYNTSSHTCCCGGDLQKAWAGIYTKCCYGYSYDSRTGVCCEGAVAKKPYPSADCCCWRQAFDSRREICCGGKVRSRCVGLFTKCCDTEAYDPGYKICCDGKLYNRVYGHDTYCCGKSIYTPRMAACCGGRIAYRKLLKMEW